MQQKYSYFACSKHEQGRECISTKHLDLSRLLSDYEVSIENVIKMIDSPSGTALKIAEVVADAKNIESRYKYNLLREEGEIGVHKTVLNPMMEIIIYHNAFNKDIARDYRNLSMDC